MYDEISTQSADYQAPEPTQQSYFSSEMKQIEGVIADVLRIEHRQTESDSQAIVRYTGQLTMDAESAFEYVDAHFATMGYHAFFTTDETDEKHMVIVFRGRHNPSPRPVWVNLVLFILTIFSTMFIGALIDGDVQDLNELAGFGLLRGLPYTLSVMLILGSHELGHYFAARYHKISVTLPYFIPFPFGLFGTFGAFIQLREPMRNRRQLFDIGISGPLMGLVFAIPIIIIGIATAKIGPLPTVEECRAGGECSYALEGNSLFYGSIKYVIHGKWLPDDVQDMQLNQLAYAGWTGLFVTGLNLIPVGQLDGGHILYTLFGKQARVVYYPALMGMVILAIINQAWILWVILLFFLGRHYAVPMNDITPLDNRRRILGYVMLVVFVLVYTPNPFRFVDLT